MDAIELLIQQHDEVDDLFEQIEEADDDEEKATLVQALADNLAAHATIEEKIFYPAAYREQTDDLLHEAVEEHLAIKRIVADLLEMTPADENFDAKVKVLKEQVEHHVEEEESDLFPKIKKALKASELERLGDEMEALFESEMQDEPARKVPGETQHAAPVR